MKTIDVLFNNGDEFATGRGADRWSTKKYAYFVTDAQAQRIVDEKIEFAVVRAPTDAGGLKVVKIVGQPADEPEKATRRIVDLVDMAGYDEDEKKIKLARQLQSRIKDRANELVEQARLEALAASSNDPSLKAMLEELRALGV